MNAPSERQGVIQCVLKWIRNNYPTYIPQTDIVALTTMLRHNLNDHEIAEVIRQVLRERDKKSLISIDDISDEMIVEYIRKVIDSPPRSADINLIYSILCLSDEFEESSSDSDQDPSLCEKAEHHTLTVAPTDPCLSSEEPSSSEAQQLARFSSFPHFLSCAEEA